MIANFIYQLERDLLDAGMDYSGAHHLAWNAQDFVEHGIMDIINIKMVDAMEYAASIKADEFIQTADVFDMGNKYEIASYKGTDFSTEARPMLPSLLKNAKIAKDGSLYQNIPIGGSKSSFDREAAISDASRMARDNASNAGRRDVTSESRSIYNSHIGNRTPTRGTPDTFRTATSKQNPATQWVYPAQSRDMTEFLHNLNEQMNIEIHIFLSSVRDSMMERV